MAFNFSLTKKGAVEPTSLDIVDDEIRKHVGAAPDSDHWYEHWCQIIGLALSGGSSWEEVGDHIDGDFPLMEVAAYLKENYDVRAWRT